MGNSSSEWAASNRLSPLLCQSVCRCAPDVVAAKLLCQN